MQIANTLPLIRNKSLKTHCQSYIPLAFPKKNLVSTQKLWSDLKQTVLDEKVELCPYVDKELLFVSS